MGDEGVVTETREGRGRGMARPYDASILDAYGNIATVRILSSVYQDYLQLARFHRVRFSFTDASPRSPLAG